MATKTTARTQHLKQPPRLSVAEQKIRLILERHIIEAIKRVNDDMLEMTGHILSVLSSKAKPHTKELRVQCVKMKKLVALCDKALKSMRLTVAKYAS
jgi:hypothetical protein